MESACSRSLIALARSCTVWISGVEIIAMHYGIGSGEDKEYSHNADDDDDEDDSRSFDIYFPYVITYY